MQLVKEGKDSSNPSAALEKTLDVRVFAQSEQL